MVKASVEACGTDHPSPGINLPDAAYRPFPPWNGFNNCACTHKASGPAMLGCGLAHIEHFCYDYALLTWRSLMGSCCGKRDSVSHQGRVGARHQVSHRVGVVLGLFALLAMLASHVVHTVDISIEAARTPAMVGSSLHPHSQGAAAARFTTVAVPQGKVHDPFLCPVCQNPFADAPCAGVHWHEPLSPPSQRHVWAMLYTATCWP